MSINRAQGERASRRFIEFFTANIHNRNTRMASARAIKHFFDWCDKRNSELEEIAPLSVAAGAMGPVGARGPVGNVASWTAYRVIRFGRHSADIWPSQEGTVSEIAEYMASNPSLQIGIDGTDPSNQGLGDRRASSVRSALIQAGVGPSRIQTGAFGDPQLRRKGQVEVLISSAPVTSRRD